MAFYFAYVFAQEILHTQGAIILQCVSSAPTFPMKTFDREWTRILSCIPFKIHKTLFARSPQPGKEALLDSIAYQERRCLEFRTGLPAIEVAGKSAQETLQLLREHGIEQDSVPKALGGTYDYTKFYAWVRERQRLEDALHGTGVIARVSNLSSELTEARTQHLHLQASYRIVSQTVSAGQLRQTGACI